MQEAEDLGELHLQIRASNRAFAIRIVGDSMRDAHVVDGDIVVADPEEQPLDRSIVLALIDGEYTVKVLRKTSSTWWLEAANESYRPVIPKREGDRVEAIAHGFKRLQPHPPMP